jgi:hypothetical protein
MGGELYQECSHFMRSVERGWVARHSRRHGNREHVYLTTMPGDTYAVLQFGGWADKDVVVRNFAALATALGDQVKQQIHPCSPPFVA